MKLLSALVFPETEPAVSTAAEFLLFFDSLSYYLPTETELQNSSIDILGNLCRPYAPAPPDEEELFRFNRLLREMETGRPDELARLFSSGTAPLNTPQTRDADEISASRVYSTLQQDAGTKTSIRYRERLWQARLILKLAEMLDRREAEVRQGLARISSKEQKVFTALEGQDETGSEESAEINGTSKLKYPEPENIMPDEPSMGTSGLLVSLRIKAWAELFLADATEQQPAILAAANVESGSSLLDGYENIWCRSPLKLFSLSVPSLHFNNKKAATPYLAGRETFRQTIREPLECLAGFLEQTAVSAESLTESRQKTSQLVPHLSAWEENVRRFFPPTAKDYSKLEFYCFPSTSMAELLQRLYRLETTGPANRIHNQSGILAVLVS